MSEIQEFHTTKEIKDILNKCRCCLRLIIDDRRAVDINENIRDQFYNLTKIQLIEIDVLANRICQLCAGDLETFSNLRNDLIEKQSSLYEILGLDQQEIVLEETSESVTKQEKFDNSASNESTVEYELVERDDVCIEEFLWDETADDNSDINDEANTYVFSEEESTASASNSQLKIEKVSGGNVPKSPEMEIEPTEESYEEYDGSQVESSLDQENVECNLCNIQVLQTHFDLHCEVMHIDERCEKCDKIFPSKILLKRHTRDSHSLINLKGQRIKRKVHLCSLCDKEYDYKKHLDDHIRSFHKKERNRQCPICNRWFYHRDIKKHIEHVHGERKVTCKICGKLYTCLENLKLHMRYHDEPKYMCEIQNCGKRFHQKILLEHHMLKHSEKKPIECPECKNLFYTTRDLNRHTLRVHKKVTRKCFNCPATFYRKDKYREHIIKQHKELTDEERLVILESVRTLNWNEDK